jgi:two-component system, chemotaxis family, protein-glutamate methylesterase/glutaminase
VSTVGGLLERRIDAVVLGASAGGVEALTVLLPCLPARLRAAMLIVVHVPRERPSLLTELFTSKCALQVKEAEDKMPVEPGTVYFAPPNYHLLLDKGPQLALSVDDLVHFSRPSIDVLFQSAADIYGKHLVGIILTGANEDGTAGLAAVHRGGGVTIVQEPSSAQAPRMAASALKETQADYVLPLNEIGMLLKTLPTSGPQSQSIRAIG